MKGILVAVVMVVVAGTASAGPNPLAVFSSPSADHGLTARTAGIDARSGGAVPAVTALNPVVGSVQRTGHFVHPHTGKTKYSQTVYNPVLGQFGARTFRR